MTEANSENVVSSDIELQLEREFDAPRELVFKMWSDPAHFRNWAAPTGFTVTNLEMEFRVGGIYRVCLRSPEGEEFWIKGHYQEISEPEWFSLTTGWESPDGSVDHETLLTVTFEEAGERTRLTLRQTGFNSTESRDGNKGGWAEVLDSLFGYLKTETARSDC